MLEILIFGAVTSAIYAMLAVGFTLIFGVARILNLAHGSFYALGAYGAYVLTTVFKVPLIVATPLVVLGVALFGMLVERVLIRPMRKSQLAVLMISLAVSLVVEQALFLIFGSEYRNVPSFIDQKYVIGGVDVAGQRLLTLLVAVVSIGGLYMFIQKTRLGSAILAISQDPEAAQYMGIPSDRIFGVVMAMSAGLAALAGIMAGPFLSVQPSMHLLPIVKAFAIVVVGGLGSIPGSIVAALMLGYAETLVAYGISTSWTEIVSVAATLLMLVLRPAGFFGKRAAF
ncbi:branched-chain amino acid ABC transporter permease [Limnohabitans sp. B9-3]|uniref:branched-chain amino acid ABC transporter permease n=1 Tax=Limnohabitans sp. B9-3 TaxID=1100707 RepID=UPI000C1F8796|nr:branched-chain amino acid ABC transporter permease [Limnohabitans sp. B9-3]PIT77685.1 branched-chain amino acid ABC transporter permease [Limnohabitans sp. B9-3]